MQIPDRSLWKKTAVFTHEERMITVWETADRKTNPQELIALLLAVSPDFLSENGQNVKCFGRDCEN